MDMNEQMNELQILILILIISLSKKIESQSAKEQGLLGHLIQQLF